eukprot:XP_017456253.1 PREDICTED: uncharacterized protein LOC102546342 isoform X1 [Rattus norvegicus]
MRQRQTRKKIATLKGCRDAAKIVDETKTLSQPMKMEQLLQDTTPHPWLNRLQKMEHLLIFQPLSHLNCLEYLIHKEFSHIFWGISTLFSESVVAAPNILRNPSLAQHKTLRFHDACRPAAQVVFPYSSICDSKEEYYSKAAMILENLHHQDPGGARVENASTARLESALWKHSAAEVQENQRAPQPDASHGPSQV